MRKVIHTQGAPDAIGPYSQAVAFNELIFCSGQLPLDPQTNQITGQTAGEQTRQVMNNLKTILESAGSDLNKVLKCTIFMRDLNDFSSVNAVYGQFFPVNPPARACVEVSRLPKDALVEIECVAAL